MTAVVIGNPTTSGVTYNIVPTIMFALITAISYYALRQITSSPYVILAIGIGLALLTTGVLQTIGVGLVSLGVARLIDKEIVKIESS